MNEQVFGTISMELEGIDLVWDFSIFSDNENIRNQCNNFIADLYLYNVEENSKKRGKTNTTFFDTWLNKILTIDETNKKAISNILKLLFNFVKRYDGHHMDSEYFERLEYELTVDFTDHPPHTPKTKVFKVNKEMTIGAIRKQIGDFYNIIPSEILIISSQTYLSECCMNDKLSAYRDCKHISIRRRTREERENELPRCIVASNLSIVREVIEKGLESESHEMRCEALQFLEYTPPNTERREKMIKCKKLLKGNNENWISFMYCTGFQTQGLYYGLKIMKSILISFEPFNTKSSNAKFHQELNIFQKKFLECEGFAFLCDTLNELKIKSILKDVVWLSIFQILIQILTKFLQNEEFVEALIKSNKIVFFKSMTKLISTITQVLYVVSQNTTGKRDLRDALFTAEEIKTTSEDKIIHIIDKYEFLETNFSSQCIQLLSSCFYVTPKEADQFYNSDFIKSQGILNLLVFYPNKKAMNEFSESLYELCKRYEGSKEIRPNPAHFFIQSLQKDLKLILDSKNVIQTEFNLWDDIIKLVPHKVAKDVINSVEIAEALYDTIYNRQIFEDDNRQDYILSGSLRIL